MALTEIPIELSSTPSIVDGGNATAITIDSSENVTFAGNVGIGGTPTDGTLHVHTATAGTVAASTQADDIVIENSAEGGMTIITPDDQSARIRFTSPSTNNDVGGATIFYRQNINRMNIGTEVAGGILTLISGAGSETMRLDASGNVGIGMTPSAWHANWTALQLGATGFVGQYQAGGTDLTALGSNVFSDGAYRYIETDEAVIYKQQDGEHIFDVAASGSANAAISWTTALTINNSGNVGIGITAPGRRLEVAETTNYSPPGLGNSGGHFGIFKVDSGASKYGLIAGVMSTGSVFQQVQRIDGTATAYNLALQPSGGAVLVGTTGTTLGGSQVIAAGVQSSHTTGAQTMTVYNSSTSCGANGIFLVGTARTANSAFDIFNCWTSAIGDKEFKVRGDGNVFADGTFSGGGADYAEFFEWLDGNSSAEDRRGYSVVLDSGKIRAATSEDDASQIIGVISANPAMIGDNDMERWRGKYLRDDFGSYDLDSNGDKQLSSDYDEAQSYVSREDRVEWDIVGLMGKLRIHKGQPTGSNWIKIKDISAGIEEWLVR
jgi:hypothetical protein